MLRLHLRPPHDPADEPPPDREATARVLEEVRNGQNVSDRAFDTIYPSAYRKLSDMHWTPVRVARRAARLLVGSEPRRVLDVGSGVGKFCLVGALTTPGTFVGVERRDNLVAIAEGLVRDFAIPRLGYVLGDVVDADFGAFDGIYLFNPFWENVHPLRNPGGRFPLDKEHFDAYVRTVVTKLDATRPGTRVVVYHGFGGSLPDGFARVAHEEHRDGGLDLWVKRAP